MTRPSIEYLDNKPISVEQAIDPYRRSTLGERRPADRPNSFEIMLKNASLTVTPRHGAQLVSIARSLTDFTSVAYLADLAVDAAFQTQGIGRRLLEESQHRLGPVCMIVLFAGPKASDFYAKLGFEQNSPEQVLRPRSA